MVFDNLSTNLTVKKLERQENILGSVILQLFCLHRRFIFDNPLTGEAQQSLFDIINSVAMWLVEFI